MKKPSFSFFIVWLFLFASFPASFVSAQTSCGNFNASTYTVPSGASSFLINTPISTNLAIHSKRGSVISSGNVQILILMDRSGSMRSPDANSPQTKIEAAREAMSALVDVLSEANKSNNQVALVTFAGDATTNLSFTNYYPAARVAISRVVPTPGSGTAIGNGLYEAGTLLRSRPIPSNTKRFIILASDGVQTTGLSLAAGKASIPSDVTVYTIGIGADGYLNGAALTDIAQTAGTGNGEYLRSTVPELVNVFRDITHNILSSVTLSNVSLAFTRDDLTHTNFSGTLPANDSYSPANGIIRWNNLGSMLSGQTKNIAINYQGTQLGRNIPLNTFSLVLKYDIAGMTCTDSVPVNVLSIEIADVVPPLPLCRDTSWAPSRATVCTTQTLTQTSNCSNTRTVSGTKTCAQCSDGIDNDGDGFIDYDGGASANGSATTARDRGCSSLLDDNEKNSFFHFWEF